jgi:phosphotransferase system HPr (HPr) family protein
MKQHSWESRVQCHRGVHCRVASRMVEIVEQHDACVEIHFQGDSVDCTSMLEILSLSLSQGAVVSFHAQGPEAEQVAAALDALLAQEGEDSDGKSTAA